MRKKMRRRKRVREKKEKEGERGKVKGDEFCALHYRPWYWVRLLTALSGNWAV